MSQDLRPVDAIIMPSARPCRDYCPTRFGTALAGQLRASQLVIRGASVAGARNAGLAAARALGWHRVMFLDDDIRLSAQAVRQGAQLLPAAQAAAFLVTDFPDNSVVRHAARAGGMTPPVFPSGGALIIDVPSIPPATTFPEGIYNEDWLFLHDLRVAIAGTAGQLPYDPFVPGRAAREEFGDLIAEAIAGRPAEAGIPFWEEAIAQRARLLREVSALSLPASAAASVAEARQALSTLTAGQAAGFVTRWQAGVFGRELP